MHRARFCSNVFRIVLIMVNSVLRQVPDNQEVFMDQNSDTSIVIEILQSVEPVDSNGIARQVIPYYLTPPFPHFMPHRFHFDSLAHDNSAISSSLTEVWSIPNHRGDKTPSAIALRGVQHVSKFNRTTPDEVHILMAIFRVDGKDVDLVVTFNVPVPSHGNSAREGLAAARTHFETFVKSLRIIDFDLFV